jgi:hypothetical protein
MSRSLELLLKSKHAPALLKYRDVIGALRLPSMRFKGKFIVRVWNESHTVIKRELQFDNLIVNSGMDNFATNSFDASTIYVAVGTGSSTPAVTDTALNSEIARTNFTNSISDTHTSGPSFSYWEIAKTRLFTAGQATGNLTELGMFQNSSGAPMFTRQLFKDGGGSPTTVTVTPADQLEIIYLFKVFPPSADVTGNVTIQSVSYPFTVRAIFIDDPRWGGGDNGWPFRFFGQNGGQACFESNALLTQTGTSLPAVTNADSTAYASYTSGSFHQQETCTYNPGTANFSTGIGSIVYGPVGAVFTMFQLAFTTTKVPKISTQTFTLTDQISWARDP